MIHNTGNGMTLLQEEQKVLQWVYLCLSTYSISKTVVKFCVLFLLF